MGDDEQLGKNGASDVEASSSEPDDVLDEDIEDDPIPHEAQRGFVGKGKRKVDLSDYASFQPQLVSFEAPPNLPPDHLEFVSKVVVLDHRSLHALGPDSAARAEVRALLMNAVITAGYSIGFDQQPTLQPIDAAAALYREAEKIHVQHVAGENRLRYIGGVGIGIAVLTAVASLAFLLPNGVQKEIGFETIAPLIWFAGLGSIVSVLVRLGELDVGREITKVMLFISGAGRPVVASALALVLYLAFKNGLLAITLGAGTTGAYFVMAFLCGFSERYANDILDAAEAGMRPPSERIK